MIIEKLTCTRCAPQFQKQWCAWKGRIVGNDDIQGSFKIDDEYDDIVLML